MYEHKCLVMGKNFRFMRKKDEFMGKDFRFMRKNDLLMENSID
jgi:hypothetical protein